eukprot:m.311952 g.311952  ORF g.311952 m.311952 type:complete len:119 (-) comp19655_c0_seq9:40-396(-)
MQLRKICNHAELMQRREVSSPFVFEGPRWKCASRVVTRAPPMPSVVYNTENAIEYTLPTLVFADVAHGSVAESRLAVVRRMSMFSPDNVLQSSLGVSATLTPKPFQPNMHWFGDLLVS